MSFVELDRDFAPLKKDQPANVEAGQSWGRKLGGWLTWPEILSRRRVVLLAEAACGKTEEFKNQQRRLQDEGKAAFFLRIEELADHGFAAALSGEEVEAFDRWQAGTGPGWFFLDSVDEARLVHKSFETALKRFARELQDNLDRANIFVSCRITDWHGVEDFETVGRYLRLRQLPMSEAYRSPSDALLEPIFPNAAGPSTTERDAGAPLIETTVLQLVPLSPGQYRALAKSAGVSDVDMFVAAITRQGLEAFTERPGDLLDLANYWVSNSRFGSFAEMVEHGITRKLAESDTHRADSGVLSETQAREGAERVAAALTFGKSFTLRAPSRDPDGGLTVGALDAAAILPEWTPDKRNALLRRGIFAPATYGRVRFHHRSTQEFLTASWLRRLLEASCPLNEVWNLLFAERYGVETVVPSLRPIAAWLGRWRPEIQAEIVKREPLVLMRFGDPGSVPLAVKEELLSVYAAKNASSEIVSDRWESRSLWMFADQRLAPAISKAWGANSKPDFRDELLRLIRDGGIKGCTALAREAALDEKTEWHRRALALHAVGACGDEDGLHAIARQIMTCPSVVDARLAASFASVLYPKYLKTTELLDLIRDSKPVPKGSTAGFGYGIEDLYQAAPDAKERELLVGGMTELCLLPPFRDSYSRVNKRFRFLAKQLHDITLAELERSTERLPFQALVRLLMVTERIEPRSSFFKRDVNLYELVSQNRNLSHALFWADVEEQRRNGPGRDSLFYFWQVYSGGSARTLWNLDVGDRDYLVGQLKARKEEADRRIILSAIMGPVRPGAEREAVADLIRPILAGTKILESDLAGYLAPPAEHPTEREHVRWVRTHEQQQKEQERKDKASWEVFADLLRCDPSLISDPQYLASWKAGLFRLKHLLTWLQHRSKVHSHKALRDWRLTEEGFGKPVADAFRSGLGHVWRLVRAARPVHQPGGAVSVSWSTILAFGAIGVESVEDPDWPTHLSIEEARKAAQHGCLSEQGYPDWLDQLARAFPTVVMPSVRKAVQHEWATTEVGTSDFLCHYSSAGASLPLPVQSLLLDIFLRAEAGQVIALTYGVSIVRRLQLDDQQKTELIAAVQARLKQHRKSGRHDFAFRYLAILFLLAPALAVDDLARWIEKASVEEQCERAEEAFSSLFDRHDSLITGALDRASVATLEKLLYLAYSHIHMMCDIVHEGSFTPNKRDRAEGARNTVLSALMDRPGADAYGVVRRAAVHPDFGLRSDRFLELAKRKAEQDTELPEWLPAEIVAFEQRHVAPVKNGQDLLRVVLAVLADIGFRLTSSDASSRALLERAKDEDEVQSWLAEQMNYLAKGRYQAHREAEVSGGDKPDIIISSTSAPVQVAIEIKHGDKGWTIKQLEDALRKQLAAAYLKPEERRHGVLVVTNHRDRFWQDRASKTRFSFDQLMERLSLTAQSITSNDSGEIKVAAAGLNAWRPTSKAPVTDSRPPERSTARKRGALRSTKKAK